MKMCCDVGAATGNETLFTVAPMPLWEIAIITYLFLPAGVTVPIWHHVSLCAGYAAQAAYMGGGSNESCILWGIAAGVAAAYAGDYSAKCFCVYGDGYVDPPTMAILILSVFLLGIFPAIGATNPTSILYWIIPAVTLVFFAGIAFIHHQKCKNNG